MSRARRDVFARDVERSALTCSTGRLADLPKELSGYGEWGRSRSASSVPDNLRGADGI